MSEHGSLEILLALKGRSIKSYSFDKEKILIGRDLTSDICLDNMGVSREHARLEQTSDGYFIEDNSSSNGTYLNDMPIKRAIISHRDVITIGKFSLTVMLPGVQTDPGSASRQDSFQDAEVEQANQVDGTTILSTDQLAHVMAATAQQQSEPSESKAPDLKIVGQEAPARQPQDKSAHGIQPFWVISVIGAFLVGMVIGALFL